MIRRSRPAAGAPGQRPERLARPFEGLAALRGKLKPGRAAAPAKPFDPSKTAARAPDDRVEATAPDDLALFRASVGDATPLPDRHRAEIEAPKPPPVPRPRIEEPEPAEPAKPRLRSESLDDAALFRAAMEDVTPLALEGRVEVGRAPRHPRALSRGADEQDNPPPGTGGFLPSDADTLSPADLFRYATRGTQALEDRNRAELLRPAPLPEPLKHSEDEQAALRESLDAPLTLEDRLEMGDEAAFLRDGLPRRVLADLRRGRWVLQGEVDLHGFNREEAREALAHFLAASLKAGRRCVRVIHGKGLGSPGKESILKQLARGWLAQREEILAFCQAGPYEGGSGALLVLLNARRTPRGPADPDN